MDCNHTKGDLYFQMYWYRQLPGETIKLIVFTSTGMNQHDFGEFSKDKFSATKTVARSGTFTVKNLELKDEGLYFCAVSQHSDTGYMTAQQKPKCNRHTKAEKHKSKDINYTAEGPQVPQTISHLHLSLILEARNYSTLMCGSYSLGQEFLKLYFQKSKSNFQIR